MERATLHKVINFSDICDSAAPVAQTTISDRYSIVSRIFFESVPSVQMSQISIRDHLPGSETVERNLTTSSCPLGSLSVDVNLVHTIYSKFRVS